MKKLKGAVIGSGGLGKLHLANLLKMDDVQVSAVCTPAKEQFSKMISTNLGTSSVMDMSGVRIYADECQMLEAEQLDFVVVALPTFMHASATVMALEKGVNVLCEKPMARSLEQCRTMVEAAQRSGKLLTIGQCIRFDFAYERIKEAYDTGKYGKLLRLEMSRNSFRPLWGYNNWFMDFEKSGGAAIDMHVHDVDFIQYLLGKPEAVRSEAYHVWSGFDCISTQYFYPDGPIVHAVADWNMPESYGFRADCLAVFERAAITLTDSEFKICTQNGVLTEKDFSKEQIGDPYYKEMVQFLRCIREGTDNTIVTKESTMLSIEIAEAEMASAQQHATVTLR